MFSTSPVVKAPPTSLGGFVVTEEDYTPHAITASLVNKCNAHADKLTSGVNAISAETSSDVTTPNTIAPPHFSVTSLTGGPTNGPSSAHFRRDDVTEGRRFSAGGGFTVSTGGDTLEAQISPTKWSDAPPATAANGLLPPVHLDPYRTDRATASAGVGATGATITTTTAHGTFAQRGPYSSPHTRQSSVSPHSVDHGSPFTYHGPGGEHQRNKRLHQDFKALSKEERQTLVEKQAAVTDLLERTVHLRFLPTCMRQSELAEICSGCGEYLRVRICGNSTSNQNWIYGFVEFADKAAADRMLGKSGMELFNGPGRPPLRLKCNAAKQPIVDRVFHDADPESNSPCIFGLGNFAGRTLKDALDSYFNLKAKEQQQQQQAQSNPLLSPHLGSDSSQGGTSPQLNSMGTSITSAKLSPQAKAFVPGQGFIGNGGNSSFTESAPPYNSAGRITPMSMPPATGSTAYQYTSRTSSSSAEDANEAPANATPFWQPRQPSSVLTDFLAAKSGGARTPMNFTPTTRDSPAQLFPPPSYGLSQDDGSLGASPTASFPTSFGAGRSAHSDMAVVPDLFTAGSAAAARSSVLPAFATSPAPSLLSTAAPAAMTMPQSDAEVVVQRAARMAVSGLRLAESFLRANEGFFDAAGTLRALLDLLQRHAALTGGPANTTSRDFTAELPQKTTQLRLFANVVLALLYLCRRAFSEALPFVQAAVTVCKEIGHERLVRPRTLARKATMTPMIEDASGTPADRVVGRLQGRTAVAATGEKTFGAFFAHQDAHDMIYASMEECLEENGSEACGMGTDAKVGSTAALGSTPVTDSLDHVAEALYARDVRFHTYVWNALIALGIALEEVRPDISHSVFGLASSQARDVLQLSSPALDQCLHDSAEHIGRDAAAYPRLSALLYPEVASRGLDITTFPRLFFLKSRELPLEAFLDSADEEFWRALPPNHCVPCFSA